MMFNCTGNRIADADELGRGWADDAEWLLALSDEWVLCQCPVPCQPWVPRASYWHIARELGLL